MYRTLVIVRHTFIESILQPIYSLLLTLGAGILVIFALLPFFTLGEDATMFKAVTLDVVLLLVLISTLFAASRSIFEEIEDRTMLTLMSKPIAKWEVLVGKYLGIILSALLSLAVLGSILSLCLWFRAPADFQMNTSTLNDLEREGIYDLRLEQLAGIGPSLLLMWLQISVLAAVSVAISTRVSLVVNLPAVILVYIAGNLTRFLPAGFWGNVAGTVLPYLANFDLRQKTIYGHIALAGTSYANDVAAIHFSEIWSYIGFATAYAICYASLALTAGMLLFQGRELGGGEG